MLVMGEVPVLLIVIETIPPPFHDDESAKERPARQAPEAGAPEDEELVWLAADPEEEVLVVAVVAVLA